MSPVESPSPFKSEIAPWRQAIATIIAMIAVMILFFLPSKLGLFEVDDYFPWTVAAGLTLLFGIANSVLSLASDDLNTYWGRSIISYMIVMVVGGLIAWILSGMTVYEAKSFRSLYVVFTFVYLVFLCITRAIRKIVKIAIKQDAKLRGEDV